MTAAAFLLATLLAGGGAPCAAVRELPSPIVCGDAGLRRLDAELAGLAARVRAETAGVDGESGRAIDPVAAEQRRWRRATLARCRDRGCIDAAYRSRIRAIRLRWADALR